MADYRATSEIAAERLGAYVKEGEDKARSVLANLAAETRARVDIVVPRDQMVFAVTPDMVTLNVERTEKLPDPLAFTQWSRGQVLGDLGLRADFIKGLQGDGAVGAGIATDVMNRLKYRIGGEAETNGKSRRLLRVVHDDVKGWLSPTYGMFDQSEIVGGFMLAVQNAARDGIVFTDGTVTDRRYALTAIWPQLVEVWEGELVVFGGQLQSSDYGFGAVDFMQTIMRLTCRNGSIGQSFFRKIHRGSGFEGDANGSWEISAKTRELGSQHTVSLLTDAVSGAFSNKAIEGAVAQYRLQAGKVVDPLKEAEILRKQGLLTKDEVASVPALIGNDVDFLPNTANKNSALRFGQLMSWIGGQKSDSETKLGLLEAAGKFTLGIGKGAGSAPLPPYVRVDEDATDAELE